MNKKYNKTIYASFVGYIVQAIVNNFVPLLFLTFESSYGIELSKITFLITINFGVQLAVDFLSAYFVDKIGYRVSIVMAHVFSAAGLAGLVFLPEILNPYTGILISVIVYAVGGGLIEVLISPIMESCPTENKEKSMSILHSFYCWGHMAVIIISTLFFTLFGIDNWKILTLVWMLVPVVNGIVFMVCPIAPLIEEGEEGMTIKELVHSKYFWILMIVMSCAGASEQSVSQWASTFAEQGLLVSKTVGDLAGPMMFALFMGCARAFYGKFGHKINLDRFMIGSGILCVLSYCIICLSPNPFISLVGCSVCGLSVGIMWPGTFSIASSILKNGGTALFALLALAGDLGCAGGPTLAGYIAGRAGDNLKAGILCAVIFPIMLVAGVLIIRKITRHVD